MLDERKVRQAYQENYQMAIEDGHQDNARKVAWEWTEEAIQRQLAMIKDRQYWQHVDAVNKAFYG